MTEDAAQIDLRDLRRLYRLGEQQATILKKLLVQKMVTSDEICAGDKPIATNPKVAIHNLRRRLEPFGIRVSSLRTLGYWLESDVRETILKQLRVLSDQSSLSAVEV